jgi:DNA-binding transcriptional LysR family regulator
MCRLNINTAESATDAAIAGVGITPVLSYQVARAMAELELQEFQPKPMPVHLIHAVQGGFPSKCEAPWNSPLRVCASRSPRMKPTSQLSPRPSAVGLEADP